MAHSSCLGPDRTCDHATEAAQHLRTIPANSGIGRRHRMGASLGGPLPRPSRAITPGLAPDRPRPWPTRGAQELGEGEYIHSRLLPGPKVKTGPELAPGPPLV